MEPTDTTIRRATAADAPLLARFNLAMAEETEGHRLAPEVVEAGVLALFDDPARGFYLVAERQGGVVGSLMVTREWSDWRNADFWWIQSVYVHPEHRRRGVYRLLYKVIREAAATKAGVCGLRLYVERDNLAAQATYAALGMVETAYRLYEATDEAPGSA